MVATRRQFLAGMAAAGGIGVVGTSCVPGATPPDPNAPCLPPAIGPAGPLATPGSTGLVDEAWFQTRATGYLEFATTSLSPGNATNVAAHLMRAQRDPGFSWDPSLVTVDAYADTWTMFDGWKDTSDFVVMYLLWLVKMGPGILDPALITKIEDELVAFRYRWDDPLPSNRLDNKWFWSENHRLIFAVIEYLAGTFLPDRVFTVTQLTGAQHAARARPVILRWIDERARFGFSEWHSHVYMLKNISPLITLIELSDDDELIRMGVAALDLCLFDIAAHTHAGAYGATHGRTYKKDKMTSQDEDTFGTAKLLFDDTDRPYPSTSDGGAVYLSGAVRYRMPEVLRRIAVSDRVHTVEERHGVRLDPHEPFSLVPKAPYGYDYDDPADLPFWWSQGALTAWQVVPLTVSQANKFRLWDTDLFKEYSVIKPFASLPPTVIQAAARELAPMAAAGLLGEVNTVTWRSPDVMLSSAINHRPGDFMEQAHAWQATLDPDALVFTTHPQKPTPQSLDWDDDDGYWTGTASMPLSVQRNNVAIHVYRPGYDSPTDDLLGPVFGYLPETHAYFPQDHFDEVVQVGNWTCGRKGDGYVGLWSYRPTTWRVYDPTKVATNGMTKPFDLVATGGAGNAWICEVGRAADNGSFASFVASLSAASIAVDQVAGHLRVKYTSPTQGALSWPDAGSKFTVDGAPQTVGELPRHRSPFGEVCHLGRFIDVSDGDARLAIDFTTGARAFA